MVFIKRDRIYETMVLRHRTTGAQDSDPQRTGHDEGSPTVAQERKPRWGRPECRRPSSDGLRATLPFETSRPTSLPNAEPCVSWWQAVTTMKTMAKSWKAFFPTLLNPKSRRDLIMTWFPLFLTDHCPLPTSAPRWCTSQHSYSSPHLPFFQFPNSMAQGEGGGLRARPTGSRRKPRALLGHLC